MLQNALLFNFSDPSSSFEWVGFIAKKYKDMFLQGTYLTLYVAVTGTIIGFIVGFILGILEDIKISKEDNIIKKAVLFCIKQIAKIYVEVFRDTPMIVQAMVIYFGLRTAGILITPIPAGILVTTLNTGAYMSETVRAGINSIDIGQREGALALGMSPMKAMFYIIIPQAFKNIIPEMSNTFLTNLKMTSVLNVIGIQELFMMAKTAGGIYYKYYEAYLVIAIIYFVLCFVFNRIFMFIEKKTKLKSNYVLAVEYMEDTQ